MPIGQRTRTLIDALLPARRGAGPLLQRDYWAVIRDSRLRPPAVAALVAARFPEFSPDELATFRRIDATREPLGPGDELAVRIRMTGTVRVRVVHRDRNSLTLATLAGHPEAGRITFGAYPNHRGDVVFHIRSRARSSTPRMYAGFLALGEAMQTNTWTEFVNRVALTAGAGVVAFIHAEKRSIPDEPDTEEVWFSPTFRARGE